MLYAPASVSISSLTIYLYLDGLLYKLVGCRGSFNLTLTSGGVGRLSFTFQGLYLSKADAAVPAATYDATRPAPFKNGTMLVGTHRFKPMKFVTIASASTRVPTRQDV